MSLMILIFSLSTRTGLAGSGNTHHIGLMCVECASCLKCIGGLGLTVYKSWRSSRKRVFGQQLNLSCGAAGGGQAVRHIQPVIRRGGSQGLVRNNTVCFLLIPPRTVAAVFQLNVRSYKWYHNGLHKLVEKENFYNLKPTSSQLCLTYWRKEFDTIATIWLDITKITWLFI